LRWAGAAVREAEGVAASIADQRVWKRAADGVAFEVERLDDVAERIQGFFENGDAAGFFDKIKMLPKLAELGSFFPKSVSPGPARKSYRGN